MPVPIPSDYLILSLSKDEGQHDLDRRFLILALSKDERNGLSFDGLRMRPFGKTFRGAG